MPPDAPVINAIPFVSVTLTLSLPNAISLLDDFHGQMPSSVRANLLDYGVVDTLGSVGATSGVHTSVSINASASVRIPSRNSLRSLPTNACDARRRQSISVRVAGQHSGTPPCHRRAVILAKSSPAAANAKVCKV